MTRRAALLIATSVLIPITAAAQPTTEPVTEPVPVPVEEASEADLAALGLDEAPDERLNIYGFMDATYNMFFVPATSAWRYVYPTESSFAVGNLNLYFTRALSDRWRSFLEVRVMYAPAAVTNADGSLTHTTAPDPANAYRPVTWGGIGVERAYLEYDVNDSLTAQVGSFLTPYGIWNVDHGSPAIISIIPPYIIGEELFPKQQTGLHLYGQRHVGKYLLAYDATLTNGRGPFQAFRDLDDNKAVGGRLELTAPTRDTTQVGLSGYRGRFTDRPANQITVDPEGRLVTVVPPGVSYDEWSLGADILIERGPVRVQAELLANQRRYRPGERELQHGQLMPDGRYLGGYVLAGYRFDRWWQVMPFAMFDLGKPRISPDNGDVFIRGQTIGVNLRPLPSVVLKAQYYLVKIDGSPKLSDPLHAICMQAAWAF